MKLVGKVILVLIIVAIAVTITFAIATPASAQPAEVWVDDDFTPATPGWGTTRFDNIQDGIDAVASPGTVHVAVGTYSELHIAESISNVLHLSQEGMKWQL